MCMLLCTFFFTLMLEFSAETKWEELKWKFPCKNSSFSSFLSRASTQQQRSYSLIIP